MSESVGSLGSASFETEEDAFSLGSLLSDGKQSAQQIPSPSKKSFFMRLERPAKPFKRAHYVQTNGRDALELEIINAGNKPDLNFIMKLGMHLVQGKFNWAATHGGTMLLEWAHLRGIDFTAKEERCIAKAHLDIYMGAGIYAEPYHLQRAKQLYLKLIGSCEKKKEGYRLVPEKMLTVKKELLWVLSYLGDGETGQQIGMEALDLVNELNDMSASAINMQTGSLCKDMEDYDSAANFFFEVINSDAMPGTLTRTEMLFIISRNLNQLEAEKAKRDGRVYVDDYRMIHLQMLQDNAIPADTSYNDWVGNWDTWASIAAKCESLRMSSIAADLYGQGLIFDYRQYRNPRCWWVLAKNFHRCGRFLDARSSLTQCLSIDSTNDQYSGVMKCWSEGKSTFEEAIHTWYVSQIIDILPLNDDLEVPAVGKMRVLLEIARIRHAEQKRREIELERLRLAQEARERAMAEGLMAISATNTKRERPKKDRNKQNPRVLWKTPEPIIYPSKLTPSECNAICKEVDGEFEYFPSTDDNPLPAGEHKLEVEFIPRNTNKFNVVELSVIIVIRKAVPVVKWRNPSAYYVGTKLNHTDHLNADLHVHSRSGTGDDDNNNDKKSSKKSKKKKGGGFSFGNDGVGNAEQLVDPPTGTFYYYLEDLNIALPEEEEDVRLFNDDYYLNLAKIEKGEDEIEKTIPWKSVDDETLLPVGKHRIMTLFVPKDRRNYKVVRKFVDVVVMPKVIPAIVWQSPPAPMTYPAVLSKFELNARTKDRKTKGKFVYYHMLNDEDVETEAYQLEIEAHRREIAERKREAAERAEMYTNDIPWEYLKVEEMDSQSLMSEDNGASVENGSTTKETKKHGSVKSKKDQEKRDRRKAEKEKKKRERQHARNRGKSGRGSPSPPPSGRISGRDSPVSLDGTEASMLSGDSKSKASKDVYRRELITKHDATSEMEDAFLKDVRLKRKKMSTGYVLPAGLCKLQCIFYPADSVMYDENLQFIYITVNPAPLEISWGAPNEDSEAAPLACLPELYDTDLFNIEEHLNAKLSTNLDSHGKGIFTYTVESVSIVKEREDEAAGEEKEVRYWLGLQEHLDKMERLMEQEDNEDGTKNGKKDDDKSDKVESNESEDHAEDDEDAPKIDGDRVTTPKAPYLPRDNTRGIIHGDARHKPVHPTGLTPIALGTLPKGHHILHVHYTPHDTRNHTSCEARVTVTVRNRPLIVWKEDYIDEIRSGVPLSEDNLDATVTETAGTISYYPPIGEYLEVGVYQLKATFVPFDSSLHDITHHNVPLTVVRKLIPKCTWEVPILVYGESVKEDNIYTASSQIPGSFKYSMSLGKMLDAGSYSIVAAFTPEDTITYANNTLVEQLVVEKLETMLEFQPRDPDQTMYLQYGEPLEDEHFCAHVTFPEEEDLPHLFGNISYSHEEGDYLPVGEHVLTAYFQPLPPYDKNYTACTTSTIVYVHKFTPLLEWTTPNPVVFGTGSLTHALLNARLKYDIILTRKEMAARGEQLEHEKAIEREMERQKEEAARMYAQQPDAMQYQGSYQNNNGAQVLDVLSFTDLEADGATLYNDQQSYYTNPNIEGGINGGVQAVQSFFSGGPQTGGLPMESSMGDLQIGMPSIATGVGTGSLASPGGGLGLAGPLTVNTLPSSLEESGLMGMGDLPPALEGVQGRDLPGDTSLNSPQEFAIPGQVNFNLSQVSLGIYTDYGSTIQGMDSVDTPGGEVGAEGPAGVGGENGVLEMKEGEYHDASCADQSSISDKGGHKGDSSNGNVDSHGALNIIATDNTLADSITMTAFEGVEVGTPGGSLTMYTKFEGGGSLEGTLEGNETLEGGMDMSLEGGVSTYHTHDGADSLGEGESTAAGEGDEAETSQERARAAQQYLDTRPYLSILPDAPLPTHSQGEQGTTRLKLGKAAPNDLFHKETEVQQVGTGELVEITTKQQGVKIKGHFRYTPDIGAVMPHAGIFTLRAIFVPQDEENVGTADITVNLTVLRARPVVRWEQPRPMFSGTALSRLELNATVHCPGLQEQDGQLEYFPNRGEHLPVGLHVLRCRYVPFKFATNNFDCQHSWAEVPLLVKPKPFNAAYLDTLATEGGKESVKRMLTKNVSDGSTSWATGATLPTLYDETRAKTAASAMRIRTGDGVLKRMASRTAEGATRFSRKGKKKEKEGKATDSSSHGGSTQRSSTAPVSTSKQLQGSGYGQKQKIDAQEEYIEKYTVEQETHVSPRTKKDMKQLRDNIAEASMQREAINSAHGHIRQHGKYEDPYENSISSSILDGSDGIVDASVEQVSGVEPYFEVRSALDMYGPNASGSEEPEEADKNNTIVQLDAFGRELIIQKDDLEEYVGNTRHYGGTYTGMASEKNFSGGIPIPAETPGSAADTRRPGGASNHPTPSEEYLYNEYDDGIGTGGGNEKSEEYLLRDIDLSRYSIGGGPDRDRIFRSKEDKMDAYTRFRYKPTAEEQHNEERLNQLARAVDSREGRSGTRGENGRDQNLYDDFYHNPRGSVDTSNSITFADLPEGASRSMFPSRSPSPDDREEGLPGGMGHLAGEHSNSTGTSGEQKAYRRAVTAPNDRSRQVSTPSATSGYSKRKLKAKQHASTSFHSSSRLSTVKSNKDDNLLYKKEKDNKHLLIGKPIFHTGAGDTGKHTAKDDIDNKRKNVPQTKPFRWNYFVDVRNVFEGNNKAAVAGEKQKGKKKDLREDKFLPLAAKARHSREGVDAEVEEWKARRQLMRLERQINSLRRDAYGIAQMVAYTEQLRKTTGGNGNNAAKGSMSPPRDRPNTTDGSRTVNPHADYGSLFMPDASSFGDLGGITGPYAELGGDEDDEEMNAQESTAQGLNRVPGIGTGAANRIISSFELENPYYEITAGPEARTGKWSSAPTAAYANSTMASDRLTDTNTRKKDKKKANSRGRGTTGGSNALLSPIKKGKNMAAAGNAVQLIRNNEGNRRPKTSA